MTKRNIFNIALCCGLISAIMLSMVGFSNSCDEMYNNIVRIRILANSDSSDDQQLKINIRDAVLNESKHIFSEIDTYDEAIAVTEDNLDALLECAQNKVMELGYDYPVGVSLRDEYFDTRVYDEFTLPAGTYKTVVFTIGEGKGENWWCVIFPQVCVGSCSSRLTDAISDDSSKYAYNSENYQVKFKTVEIYQKVKNYFNFLK